MPGRRFMLSRMSLIFCSGVPPYLNPCAKITSPLWVREVPFSPCFGVKRYPTEAAILPEKITFECIILNLTLFYTGFFGARISPVIDFLDQPRTTIPSICDSASEGLICVRGGSGRSGVCRDHAGGSPSGVSRARCSQSMFAPLANYPDY